MIGSKTIRKAPHRPRLSPSTGTCARNGQSLARAGLAPVPAVGWDREWLWPRYLALDPTGEIEAVATNADAILDRRVHNAHRIKLTREIT